MNRNHNTEEETRNTQTPVIRNNHKELQKKVREAIENQKIFTINGLSPIIQKSLLERGWVEKYEKIPGQIKFPNDLFTMSKMIALNQVNFYWTMHKNFNDITHRMIPNQVISKFAHTEFTSKAGLNLILQQTYWYNLNDEFTIKFPRSYNLYMSEHHKSFIDDFKLTACMSLVRLVSDKKSELFSAEGLVPIVVLNYATDKCRNYIEKKQHLDIDKTWKKSFNCINWEQFWQFYSAILFDNQTFQSTPNLNLDLVLEHVDHLLIKILQFSPHFNIDGYYNLWILKPANKCRGLGILLIRNLNEVDKITSNSKKSYIIQKYIEKPMLIYNTKFDIRQWFLITKTHPLTVWIYKECYLRFSSQTFDLINFHESIHLTNNAIQKKYKASDNRNKQLPEQHMWSLNEFLNYLTTINSQDYWDKIIFPGIVSNIIGTLLASQEAMDRRPNTFELFGADFMLDQNFNPWLIEINSGPDMNPTTNVTSKLCPQCLEDIIKVVVDHRRNPMADTGKFQMIYKQEGSKPQKSTGINLIVQGKRLDPKKMKIVMRPATKSLSKMPQTQKHPSIQTTTIKLPQFKKNDYKGPIIYNLIEDIRNSTNLPIINNK